MGVPEGWLVLTHADGGRRFAVPLARVIEVAEDTGPEFSVRGRVVVSLPDGRPHGFCVRETFDAVVSLMGVVAGVVAQAPACPVTVHGGDIAWSWRVPPEARGALPDPPIVVGKRCPDCGHPLVEGEAPCGVRGLG